MKLQLTALLEKAQKQCREDGTLTDQPSIPIVLEVPPQKNQGDFAAPLALSLAKLEGRSPREIASGLATVLNRSLPPYLEKIEVAGPGYINFFIKSDYWHETLLTLLTQGEEYGRDTLGVGKKILIEFVSANPTGPLHVAHGRAAALGDALTRLLRAVGFEVDQEYYINDVGNQITLLGQSTALRYREQFGEKIDLPAESYKGDYIIDIAKEIKEAEGETYLHNPDETFFRQYSYQKILSLIENDMRVFGIHFNRWFREAALYENKEVEAAIRLLREKGVVYDADGATWVATTRYGDDKDRVIMRGNGEMTYFASDIAYHKNKLQRGYDRLIDIWGADHHGYVARVKAAVEGMGYEKDRLDIVIHQLVNLLRGGKPVAMSKRSGEFVTLKEVMDEVGVDATRFFFLMRRSDTALDFDLELAQKASDENPVYYVQYAHARICSIVRVAAEQGRNLKKEIEGITKKDLTPLTAPEEFTLIKQLSFYPDLVRVAAEKLEPHRINFYLLELAGMLHRYYFNCRVITDDVAITRARFALMTAVQAVLKSALGLLGVTAPERM